MLPKATTTLTAEGKAKLQAELEHLIVVRRREVADRMHQAMEFAGDPVDNAEYQDAKDEQAFVEGRIRELDKILAHATVIESSEQPAGVIQIGCVVTVEAEDGEQDTFTLVGSTEANPFDGRYSLDSPVGHALLGRRIGETVAVPTPGGEFRYRVISVDCKRKT
jgi:transcription elongation factor GreA